MTLEPELINAILSMDAYNRGYDASIKLTGTSLGNATISTDSLVLETTNVDGEGDVDKSKTKFKNTSYFFSHYVQLSLTTYNQMNANWCKLIFTGLDSKVAKILISKVIVLTF